MWLYGQTQIAEIVKYHDPAQLLGLFTDLQTDF